MKTYLEPEEFELMEEKAATIRDKLAAVEASYKAMKLVVGWQRYTGGNVQI
jgi:hypothetical protein